MDCQSASFYARASKPDLAPSSLAPARSRLLWLPVHVVNIAVCIVGLAQGWVPGWLAPAVSLLIDGSFAGLTFLAHEALHGAVVRGRSELPRCQNPS